MNELLDILIRSNTINFFIAAGIIIFIIKKLNVSEKLQKQAEEIKNYTESSAADKENAQKRLDSAEERIKKLPEVIERIKKSTENSIKNYEKKSNNDIEAQKTDISKNTNKLLEYEIKKFKTDLAGLLSEKSIEAARENAERQLKNNPALHKIYIDKAIDELDDINL